MNAVRVLLKQGLRFPLMVYVPSFFGDRRKLSTNVTSGLFTATVEVLFYCPFERLKVHLMTSPSQTSFRDLAKVPRLFAGLVPMWYRYASSWITFQVGNYQFKNLMEWGCNTTQLNYTQMFIVGALTGLLNTSIIMPFDYAKTKCQEHGTGSVSMTQQMRGVKQMSASLPSFLRTIYKGTTVRLAHYTVHGVINVFLLDYIERKFGVN